MGGNRTTPSIFSFCQEASSSKSTAKATSESLPRMRTHSPAATQHPAGLAHPTLCPPRSGSRRGVAQAAFRPRNSRPLPPEIRMLPAPRKAKLEPKKTAGPLGLTLLTNWARRRGEGREALGRIPGTVTRPSGPPGGAVQRAGLKGTGTKKAGPGPNCKASF